MPPRDTGGWRGKFRPANLCSIIGRPDLQTDIRFATLPDRMRNRAALTRKLNEVFACRGTEEWLALLEPAGVICAPVATYDDLSASPQLPAIRPPSNTSPRARSCCRDLRSVVRQCLPACRRRDLASTTTDSLRLSPRLRKKMRHPFDRVRPDCGRFSALPCAVGGYRSVPRWISRERLEAETPFGCSKNG